MRERFWEKFSLGELNNQEWEALCDGCGQCCLKRRVDAGVVTVYGVACPLLDIETARCSDYSNRLRRVPSCHDLTPTTVPEVEGWLPETCAYRRLHNNEPLPPWHPLLAGDRARMRRKGIMVSHYARTQRHAFPAAEGTPHRVPLVDRQTAPPAGGEGGPGIACRQATGRDFPQPRVKSSCA